MLPASSEFFDKIKGTYRRLTAKIDFNLSGLFMPPNSASTNDIDSRFDIKEVINRKDQTTAKVAVLDGTWHLGEDHLLDTAYELGWWTQSVASGNEFVEPYPTLHIYTDPRPLNKVQITGDTAKGEYPVDFTVKVLYQGEVLYTVNATDNAQVSWEQNIPLQDKVDEIVFEIHKWSVPNTRAKIVEAMKVINSEIINLDNDHIYSIDIVQERQPLTAVIPIGNISMSSMQAKVNVPQIDINTLTSRKLIVPYVGLEISDGIEWLTLGEYITVDYGVNRDTLVIKAFDKIFNLTQSITTPQVMQNTNLWNVARAMLHLAGFTDEEFYIDYALQDITIPYVFFNDVNIFQVLKWIAEAGFAVVFTDNQGRIQVRRYDNWQNADVEITSDHYTAKRETLNGRFQYNHIEVAYQSYTVGDLTTVYEGNYTIPAHGTLHLSVKYTTAPAIDCEASVEGGTVQITEETYYSDRAEITLKNTGDTTANIILTIEGKPIQEAENGIVVAEDEDSVVNSGRFIYSVSGNPLIQTYDQAQALAQSMLEIATKPQYQVQIDWIGNPALEIGDRVIIDGEYYGIIRRQAKFDGGYRETLTLVKLPTDTGGEA
jgi:hypothetical protein